jgi:peroxisomal membrane protein 4
MPFAIVAAASWAGVMYMFRHRGERLQAGMGNSMRKFPLFLTWSEADWQGYLYHDSEVWTDLRTLLWHNK